MLLNRYVFFIFFVYIFMHLSGNVFAAASGVIRLELPDAAAVGKGSAFVGEANRPSAVYYNPAGIVQMGTQMSAGLTTLQPQLDVKIPSGNTLQMRRDIFIFPHVYFTTPVVKDKFYVGVGENSNWGAGNDWAPDSTSGFTRYSMIHDEFDNQDVMLVGAYKINDQLSFGAAADDDNSRLEKEKRLSQANGNDGASQTKAKDNAWGYRLAAMYKVNDQHQFGLMYRSAIHHTYEGKLYFNNLNTSSTFGPGVSYQSVFGGTSFETKAIKKFTFPQSVVLGYSFKPTNKWTFNLDVEWLDWSSVKQEHTDFPDVNATQAGILATNNPQARDWNSVWSESVGMEYAATDRLRLRGGYAHHQTPIVENNWDTSFADSNSHSITTGIGYDLTRNLTLDIAYVAVLYETRKVSNTVESAFGANLSGTYNQFINIGVATLTYKF